MGVSKKQRIKDLEAEVARLKTLLTLTRPLPYPPLSPMPPGPFGTGTPLPEPWHTTCITW